VSTTIFTPFTALQSFLLAAAAYLVAYSAPLVAVNLARREKAIPWWAYGTCARLTPRLARFRFVKWMKNPARRVLMFPDAEAVPLDAQVGDLSSPFLVFLPFYFAAIAAAWLPPIFSLYSSWLNLDSASMWALVERLP